MVPDTNSFHYSQTGSHMRSIKLLCCHDLRWPYITTHNHPYLYILSSLSYLHNRWT